MERITEAFCDCYRVKEAEWQEMKRCGIIGFGCAGYSAAKCIRELLPDCRIDVYSDTDKAPENPMLTTYYAAGRIPKENLYPFGNKEEILQKLNINYISNAAG